MYIKKYEIEQPIERRRPSCPVGNKSERADNMLVLLFLLVIGCLFFVREKPQRNAHLLPVEDTYSDSLVFRNNPIFNLGSGEDATANINQRIRLDNR